MSNIKISKREKEQNAKNVKCPRGQICTKRRGKMEGIGRVTFYFVGEKGQKV